MDPLRATQAAGAVSKFIAVGLGLAGAFWLGNFMLVLVAFFIYMAVNAETQQSMIEYMLRGIRVRELMNGNVVTVPPDATVADVLGLMVREHHLGFPVLDDGQLVGMVDLKQVQGVPPETPVAQVMNRRLSTIDEDAPALDAFTKMGRTGFGRLIAVDRARRMVGIITKTDLMRAIQIRLAAAAPRDASDLREPFEQNEELEPVRNVP
jgi:CBS domain-containing protein